MSGMRHIPNSLIFRLRCGVKLIRMESLSNEIIKPNVGFFESQNIVMNRSFFNFWMSFSFI